MGYCYVGDIMVVKLRVKVDWNDPKEQPETLYIYKDRVEADTVEPCGCGASDCEGKEVHHRTLSYDDWFLMNDTMRTIMGKCSDKCCDE